MRRRNRLTLLWLLILVFCLTVGCTAEQTETLPPTEPTEEETLPPTEPVTEPPAEETTEPVDQRMAEYQALFEGNYDIVFKLATGYEYTCPEDVDLYYLFYNGTGYAGSWGDIDKSEQEMLLKQGFWRDMDIQIMPADLLDAQLQQYFGIKLDAVKIPSGWAYSAETNTYFSNHSDAYSHMVTVTGYTDQPDGTVTLHLTVDTAHDHNMEQWYWNAAMDMTLRPADDGYQIVSNVFAE